MSLNYHRNVEELPAHVISEIESICPEDLFLIGQPSGHYDELFFIDTDFDEVDVENTSRWCIR